MQHAFALGTTLSDMASRPLPLKERTFRLQTGDEATDVLVIRILDRRDAQIGDRGLLKLGQRAVRSTGSPAIAGKDLPNKVAVRPSERCEPPRSPAQRTVQLSSHQSAE